MTFVSDHRPYSAGWMRDLQHHAVHAAGPDVRLRVILPEHVDHIERAA